MKIKKFWTQNSQNEAVNYVIKHDNCECERDLCGERTHKYENRECGLRHFLSVANKEAFN